MTSHTKLCKYICITLPKYNTVEAIDYVNSLPVPKSGCLKT